MRTLEWFRKISLREGFFLSAVSVIIAYYIFRFVQVPVLQTWWHNGIIAVICFFVLCLLVDFGIPSKAQAERLQILAVLSLTLMFLVSSGMLYYMFMATSPISGPVFGAMLIASFVVYAFFLFWECIVFFQYEEANADVTGGLICLGTDIHNGHLFTYSGLGKEPYWNETLPIRVDDYTEPRYVYADKFESVIPIKGHGRVIGYRISPTLVIHSMVLQDNNGIAYLKSELLYFINEFGGKMLEEKDIPVLRKNWDTIDNMRMAIGDTPLPKYIIPFVLPDQSMRTTHIFDGRVFTDMEFGSIIMKR